MSILVRLQNGVLPSYVAMAAWEIRCLIEEGKASGNENDTLVNVVRKMERGDVVSHHNFGKEDVQNGIRRQLRHVSPLSSISATTAVNCGAKPTEMRENTIRICVIEKNYFLLTLFLLCKELTLFK